MSRHLPKKKRLEVKAAKLLQSRSEDRIPGGPNPNLPSATQILYRKRIYKDPFNVWRTQTIEVKQDASDLLFELKLDHPVIFLLIRNPSPAERRQRGFLPPMKRT